MRISDADAFAWLTHTPTLAADEIHVWALELDAAERPRAIAAATRAVLERLLCAYANLAAPPAIERGPHGKPFAPAALGLEFNLSHAGSHALLAFARGQPLGVDIEHSGRRLSSDDIARRFFAAEEADALAQLPPEKRLACFLQLWTRKEAVLKALGEGLSFGLDRLAFAVDADGEVGALQRIAAEAGRVQDWRLHWLEPAPNMVGALAWHGPARRVRTFRLAA